MNLNPIIDDLQAVARQDQPRETCLFHFNFNGLNVRGVYFLQTNAFLIGITNYNVAWQMTIPNDNIIKNYIPNEVFRIIVPHLNDNAAITTRPFFDAFYNCLENLIERNINEPANDENILTLLGDCRTADNNPERNQVVKPYFECFLRVNPSYEMLGKIERYFGREVRQFCYKNKSTARFSPTPTARTLSFLDQQGVMNTLNELIT